MKPCRKSLAVSALLLSMTGIAGSTAAEPVGSVPAIAPPALSATSRTPGAHYTGPLSLFELPQPTAWTTGLSALIAVAFVVRRKSNWQ